MIDPPEVRPSGNGLVIANIQEILAKAPPNTVTTSIRCMKWQPFPRAAAGTRGMPLSENLVALWSTEPGETPGSDLVTTPLVHIPNCRLEVTSFPDLSSRGGGVAGKIERVALPGAVFRSLLSQTALLGGVTETIPRHFDDDEEWVFSRCLLAEFSGLGEQEASRMSDEGKLCCWASLVAMREGEQRAWDIGVVVHRIFSRGLLGLEGCGCCD
jgi:hypothetical protein